MSFIFDLMDIYSVFLSGALLTLLLMNDVDQAVLRHRYATLDVTQAWGVFLLASYLFDQLPPGNLNLRSAPYGPMIL